jgi:6-phosphogluconolactonase
MLGAGGGACQLVYQALAGIAPQWHQFNFYITDERCVPVHSSFRNDVMIQQELIKKSNIPYDQVNFIAAELGRRTATILYDKTLAKRPSFDVALLGLGEDGHIASLFTNNNFQDSHVIGIDNSPKLPQQRITVTPRTLKKTEEVIIIAGGESKRNAISDLQNGSGLLWKLVGYEANVSLYTGPG